jgi:hypothetical protein
MDDTIKNKDNKTDESDPTILEIARGDAVLVLKEGGEMDFVFPDMQADFVPENALMAAALAYALEDELMYTKLRDAFLANMYPDLAYGAKNDNGHIGST